MTDGAMSLRFLAGIRDDGVREGWRSMLECLISRGQAILSSERYTAERVRHFTESIIRDMTRINNNLGGVNMAQGFPDFPPPSALIEAAEEALAGDFHQYANTWGAGPLREAIAEKFGWYNGLNPEPDAHITVTCGGTEAMMATMLGLVDPGDEIIIFEPFYENYGPDTLISGGKPVYVPLRRVGDSFKFDPDELRKAFSEKTKAVIITTPHNPSGKVYSDEELGIVAELCQEFDALVFSDEPYEHIIFDGLSHRSIASLPGMAERTVTINSVSKTYSVTGWRIGWAIVMDATLCTAIRRAHDFLTVGAAHPLQMAAAKGMGFPMSYYEGLAADYQARRDATLSILKGSGFDYVTPQGAYYVMTEYPDCGYDDDLEFAMFMAETIGVTPVPGRAFYRSPELGKQFVRFAFPKKLETLEIVRERMSRIDEFRK